MACFEPRDMAALARCSREFAALLREDNVWSMLVERRWPHLAWAPVAPHSRTPSLDLHRERAHVADDDIGAAYELCAAFDESAALADGDDFDALARSLLRACVGVRRAAGNTERAREREVLRWQHRCARAVGVPARLTDLAAWARALEEELDLWYDEGDAGGVTAARRGSAPACGPAPRAHRPLGAPLPPLRGAPPRLLRPPLARIRGARGHRETRSQTSTRRYARSTSRPATSASRRRCAPPCRRRTGGGSSDPRLRERRLSLPRPARSAAARRRARRRDRRDGPTGRGSARRRRRCLSLGRRRVPPCTFVCVCFPRRV